MTSTRSKYALAVLGGVPILWIAWPWHAEEESGPAAPAAAIEAHSLAKGVLRGRVVDESGQPVAGAVISRFVLRTVTDDLHIDYRSAVYATSAADGTFQIDALESGPAQLEVRAPGFVPEQRTVFALGARLPEWRVVLARGAAITGRVVGAPADAELGVTFRLASKDEERYVPCADDGSFVIEGLAPMRWAFDLYAVRKRTGPSGAQDTRALPAWERISPAVSVQPGARAVEVRVPPLLTYHLQVVDATTGQPLSDAHIGLLEGCVAESDRAPDARPGPAGAYTLSVRLFESPSAVTVSHAGYRRIALGEIPFLPGETHDLGVVPLDRLAPTVLRLVSNDGGTSVEGADISAAYQHDEENCPNAHGVGSMPARSALPDSWHGTSAADGTVTAYLSPGTDYWISAGHPEHAPLTQLVRVGSNPPAELELRLPHGGAVTLLCLDARTAARLGDRSVQYACDGCGRGRTETDRDGRARFANLTPGRYHFWGEYGDQGEVSIQVDEGAELEIALRLGLDSRVRLHGTITEHGSPLVGARVETSGWETATDREGHYELEVEPGDEDLVITHPVHGAIYAERVELAPPECRADVDLAPGGIEGEVRDPDGRPVEGAVVLVGIRIEGDRFAALSAFERPLHETRTGADGRFAFAAVQTRRDLALLIEKPGFHAKELGPLELPFDGSALALQARLERLP